MRDHALYLLYAAGTLDCVLQHGDLGGIEVRVESLSDQYRFISTQTLEPEPIPLDVKVCMIGNPMIYYMLYSYDEDLAKLFKVQADFSMEIDRSENSLRQYAEFIAYVARQEKLLPFDRSAVARVAEYGAEQAADQQKLTARLLDVSDLVREASYWAAKEGLKRVQAKSVQQALDNKIWRSNRIEEQIFQMFEDGTIMVDVKGEVVGQINGLSIMTLGDYMIGRPSRLTCRTFAGRSGVIQIDREADAVWIPRRPLRQDRTNPALRDPVIRAALFGTGGRFGLLDRALLPALQPGPDAHQAGHCGDRLGQPDGRGAADRGGDAQDRGVFQVLQDQGPHRRARGGHPAHEHPAPDARPGSH